MRFDEKESRVEHTPVPEPEVRAALQRVLESAEFGRSKRVGQFLRFAVEEVLAGRGDRLKAFSIAREVYGRDESFDPRSDTIVRVEAGRLRRRLGAYYESSGRHDPVRIEVPKGRYNPAFKWHHEDAQFSQTRKSRFVPSWPSRVFKDPRYFIGGLVLAIVAMVAGWHLLERPDEVAISTIGTHLGYPPKHSSPLLAVLPLDTLSNDPVEDRLAAGLVEAIITDLTKLSGLAVMAHASLLNLSREPANLGAIQNRFEATHALRGSLERDDGRIRVNVQLIDIAANETIWADRFDGKTTDFLALEDALAGRIVKNLAVNVSPREQMRLEQRHTTFPEAFALYRQALVLIMPPNDPERIVAARHMFRRIIEIDPAFAGGYAGMSFSQAVTTLFSTAEEPHQDLQVAINMALKAIEVDPHFGMGYATLAFVYALSGRTDEALSNAGKAVSIQPGDAFTRFVYGLCLVLSGKPAEAVPPLSEAIRLDPLEPRTPYRNVLGISHYIAGEYGTAAELFDQNLRLGGPTGPHVDIFRAATYAALGETKEAQSIIEGLTRMHPQFPIETWLAKWLKDPESLERTMDALFEYGLPSSSG